MREQRPGQRSVSRIPLGLGDRFDQGSGVGHQRATAGVKQILYAGEIGIESEGASGLRGSGHDRQQLAHGIGEPLGAVAGLGKSSEGIRIGRNQCAMAIVAALEIDANDGAVVRGCGRAMRTHRRQRAHAVQQRACGHASRRRIGGSLHELTPGMVDLPHSR